MEEAATPDQAPDIAVSSLANTMTGQVPAVIAQAPYIRLLVLFGSRATGAATPKSDWDFAVLSDLQQRRAYEPDGFSHLRLYPILGPAFGISVDLVDIVDLNTCSPAIAYQVARSGRVLYERTGEFDRLQRFAWRRYADTQKFRDLRKQSIALRLEQSQ
ncbi:MAG: nucleotidyltransferase domain-containing protein [Cyanobacteria bacterium P01_A01_bin.135]